MVDNAVRKQLRTVRETLKNQGNRVSAELRLHYRCPVAWDAMEKVDERVRHCGECKSQVHDLVGLSRSQVAALVRKHNGTFCGQVMARDDGRVVFGTCTGEDPSSMARGWLIAPAPVKKS